MAWFRDGSGIIKPATAAAGQMKLTSTGCCCTCGGGTVNTKIFTKNGSFADITSDFDISPCVISSPNAPASGSLCDDQCGGSGYGCQHAVWTTSSGSAPPPEDVITCFAEFNIYISLCDASCSSACGTSPQIYVEDLLTPEDCDAHIPIPGCGILTSNDSVWLSPYDGCDCAQTKEGDCWAIYGPIGVNQGECDPPQVTCICPANFYIGIGCAA